MPISKENKYKRYEYSLLALCEELHMSLNGSADPLPNRDEVCEEIRKRINACSSGCFPTGKGFAHLRTIDRTRANIRLTPTIPSVYCFT